MTIVLDGKPFETKYELQSDGRETVRTEQGRRIASTLTISFRYELQNGGRRLRASEQLRGGGRDQDNVWVFERP